MTFKFGEDYYEDAIARADLQERITKITTLILDITPPKNRPEGWDVYDYAGGNLDDAYGLGYTDGESDLAQAIKDILLS